MKQFKVTITVEDEKGNVLDREWVTTEVYTRREIGSAIEDCADMILDEVEDF